MSHVRLISKIGQGSYGTVYRSVWRGSLIATKVIQARDEALKVFGEVEKWG